MKNNYLETNNIKSKLGLAGAKSRKISWIWYGVLAFILVGVGVYFVFFHKNEQKIKYATQTIEKKDLVVKVSATGNIEPTNVVDVGIEVSGTLVEVRADFNERVKKGDVLARIDTTKLSSRVVNSEAALLIAKASSNEKKALLANSKTELQRAKNTFKSTHGKYPSAQEFDTLQSNYDRAVANFDVAEGAIVQARAQLKSDKDDLKKAVVTSPIDGVVLARKVEAGQSVVSSMQIPVLFTLAEDLKKMQVLLSVDEADIGEVHEGQKVEFLVDAYPLQTFHGTIVQVRFNSLIVNGVVTYATVVEVDNSLLLLRPGMTATAEIITKVLKNTFAVPNVALRFSPKDVKEETLAGKQIWVLQNDTPKSIPVVVSQSDGISTAVASQELKEGMQVIVNTVKVK